MKVVSANTMECMSAWTWHEEVLVIYCKLEVPNWKDSSWHWIKSTSGWDSGINPVPQFSSSCRSILKVHFYSISLAMHPTFTQRPVVMCVVKQQYDHWQLKPKFMKAAHGTVVVLFLNQKVTRKSCSTQNNCAASSGKHSNRGRVITKEMSKGTPNKHLPSKCLVRSP